MTIFNKIREFIASTIILVTFGISVMFAVPFFLVLALAAWISPKATISSLTKDINKATETVKSWSKNEKV